MSSKKYSCKIIETCIAMLSFIVIATGCVNHKIYTDPIIEQYSRNTHWGSDVISIRQGNKFTRQTRIISRKDYYGTISQSNDTLFLNYESRKAPKDQLKYVIKNDSSLTVFILYEKIKEEYSQLSSEELKRIKKKELYVEKVAAFKYKKRIIILTNE